MQRVSICSRKAGCATVSAGQPPLLVPPTRSFGRCTAPWSGDCCTSSGEPGRPEALPAYPPRGRLLGSGPLPRPQVLGPRPGIAWGRLFHVSTPTRAVSGARRSGARHPSQSPTQAISPKSVPHGCNRAAVRLAPSESVPRGTRAVSAPARGWMRPGGVGPPAYRAKPSDQRPSQRAPGPQPSASLRARGGHPTPSEYRQAFRARAPWGSASVPAPGSPARERPTAPAAGSRLPRGNRRPSDLP
jgi:hypothetical protein